MKNTEEKKNTEQPPANKPRILEQMKPFKLTGLAAYPTVSANNHQWTEEELKAATAKFEGKPLLLDHEEKTEKVVGIINKSWYDKGLRFEAIGLVDNDLFDKLAGKAPVPPLVKGLSIGGQGETVLMPDGTEAVRNFQPQEISIVPFPAIDNAHIEQIAAIQESLAKERRDGPYAQWRDQYLNPDGSFKGGFDGCVAAMMNRPGNPLPEENARKLCAYIGRKAGKI